MKYIITLAAMLLMASCASDLTKGDGGADSDIDSDSDSDTESDSDSTTDTEEEDPCEDIVCDDIPEDACEDGQLIDYTGEASCIEGECHYSYEATDCEYEECYEDECWTPCSGIVCDETNTHNYCIDDSTLGEYESYYCWVNEEDEGLCGGDVVGIECETACIEVPDNDDYCE